MLRFGRSSSRVPLVKTSSVRQEALDTRSMQSCVHRETADDVLCQYALGAVHMQDPGTLLYPNNEIVFYNLQDLELGTSAH
jgi:hypothetical protein